MKTHLITIPKPCHEDWNAMTLNEQGRFCGQCAKTVTDFTGMKALEIQSYLLENSDKKVCGRFKSGQLDKVIINIPEKVLYTQTRFRNIFLLALLVSMGTTLLSCNNGQTIGEVRVENDSITSTPESKVPEPVKGKITCHPEELTGEATTGAVSHSSEVFITTGAVAVESLPPGDQFPLMGDVVVEPKKDDLPLPPSKKQDNEIPTTGLVKIDTIP